MRKSGGGFWLAPNGHVSNGVGFRERKLSVLVEIEVPWNFKGESDSLNYEERNNSLQVPTVSKLPGATTLHSRPNIGAPFGPLYCPLCLHQRSSTWGLCNLKYNWTPGCFQVHRHSSQFSLPQSRSWHGNRCYISAAFCSGKHTREMLFQNPRAPEVLLGMKKVPKRFSFGLQVGEGSVTPKLLKSAPLQSTRVRICYLAERFSIWNASEMLLVHFRADMAALGPAGCRGPTGLEARSLGIMIACVFNIQGKKGGVV